MSLIKTHHCCETNIGKADSKSHPPKLGRRIFKVTEWLIPGVILVILPKCPLCLVAYVALGTGIGLSVSTAANASILIFVVCVGFLAYFAAKHLYRFIAWMVRMGDEQH